MKRVPGKFLGTGAITLKSGALVKTGGRQRQSLRIYNLLMPSTNNHVFEVADESIL